MQRARLIVLLPLLALDCALNVLIGGSLRNTISAQAWHAREHPWLHWMHRAIDAVFRWQPNHCQAQATREAEHGSVWGAWLHHWRNH